MTVDVCQLFVNHKGATICTTQKHTIPIATKTVEKKWKHIHALRKTVSTKLTTSTHSFLIIEPSPISHQSHKTLSFNQAEHKSSLSKHNSATQCQQPNLLNMLEARGGGGKGVVGDSKKGKSRMSSYD
jgi:hypothetical protein